LRTSANSNMRPRFIATFVLGVATYAHELFRAVDDLDTVYVPIGLGSGICGVIGMRYVLGLRTKVVGVVTEAANTYLRYLLQATSWRLTLR